MVKILFLGMVLMAFSNNFSRDEIKIVTIDSPQASVLQTKTENIQEGELELAQEIADKLYHALEPYFPAAGLAAPQIGISKSVFIFSFDRDPKNLETVINPMLEPVGDEVVEGWEACLSSFCENKWTCAKVARYEKIRVSYMNLKGERIEKVLEGFAAKVFQHEFDHLQGYVNIDRGSEVEEFDSKEKFTAFLQAVKKQDAVRYIKPS
jgi:peptide deformylase